MSNKKKNFIVQATILGIAGILVRIIGMLYRVPLTNIIGDEGNGYYGQAYNIYTIILLISSYSIPLAISKVVSAKLSFKEYKNAHRVFTCALLYAAIVGLAASFLLYFGAPFFVDKNAVNVLRIFSPTILIYGILGVFRGYFQAHGSMVQTSISQIIEQLINAVISVLAALYFANFCMNIGRPEQIPVYGAAGSAIGTGAGVLFGLIFMLFVYLLNLNYIHRRVDNDKHREVESYGSIFKTLLFMVTPVIFSTFVYNFSTTLDMKLYYYIAYNVKNFTTEFANSQYGIFSTKYLVLMNIPVALASSISTAMIPGVSSSFATGDIEKTNKKITEATRFTMFLAIPAAVGMSVLAPSIISFLFNKQRESLEIASSLLRWGTICIIFYSISTISNSILQGIGKVNVPVRNAILALAGHLFVLAPMLYFTDWGLYALLIGTGSYSLLMCILNGISVKKFLGFRQDVKKTFVLPGIAAFIMGFAVWAVYNGIYFVIPSNAAALFSSIIIGVIIYFICLMKLKAVTEEELKGFPKGGLMIKVARKLHLI